MDYSFSILIKKDDIKKLTLSEKLAEWGGEVFSRDPPIYTSYSTVEFRQIFDLEHYKEWYCKFAKKDYQVRNHIALVLLGTQISSLEVCVNRNREALASNALFCFLQEVVMLESFVMLFIRDGEYVENWYRTKTQEELADVICKIFDWSAPEGALITKG